MKTWDETVRWLLKQKKFRTIIKDCYFDPPLIEAAKRFSESEEWKETKEIIQNNRLLKGNKVLDMGAGNGIASYALSQAGWDVTAVEPDNSTIVGCRAIQKLSKLSGYPIRVVQTYGENQTFRNNQFDLVYCRQVLHHAKDLPAMVHAIWKILKPGGIFLAAREHVLRHPDDVRVFLSNHPLEHWYHGEYAYTVNHYKTILKTNGFIIKKIFKPYDTVINMYPLTWESIRNSIQKKVFVRPPAYSVPFLRFLHNTFVQYPGILYSFLCQKPNA